MARILRGEIRWADLNPVRGSEQAGGRIGSLMDGVTPEEMAQVVDGLNEIIGT
jgi:hypothetical protein